MLRSIFFSFQRVQISFVLDTLNPIVHVGIKTLRHYTGSTVYCTFSGVLYTPNENTRETSVHLGVALLPSYRLREMAPVQYTAPPPPSSLHTTHIIALYVPSQQNGSLNGCVLKPVQKMNSERASIF